MPEFRQWTGEYESSWQVLDRKYEISKVRTLAQVLASAETRTGYPGGAKRALEEVKGDMVALYFYDRLLRSLQVLKGTQRPDMKFVYDSVSEELFPILPQLLPHGWELINFVDYTPSRIVRREDVLKEIPGHDLPSTLVYTLHDDNIGLIPQLTTDSLYKLTRDLEQDGWDGFLTRYWLIGDHDPNVAYLARAAWDTKATPDAVDREQLDAVCGERCADDMLEVFHAVEAVTVNLEWNNLGFSFPVPGMMMKHWKPGPMPVDLIQDRQGYEKALQAATRALREADRPRRADYVDYWVARLKFAVDYLNAVEAVHRAATAEAKKDRTATLREAELALSDVRQALEAYARVARDQSDRGAIATLNEYAYRPLKNKVAELSK
jgi:hypothetical protein